MLKKTKPWQVPILTYHYIRNYDNQEDSLGVGLSVSPENFERQIKYLSENNYNTISFSDLFNNTILPPQPIILTFDDGYEDAYTEAFPVLKKYNFTGTFYIITNKLYLTENQLREMQAAGMNIGVHTENHLLLPNLNSKQLNSEILVSKSKLEGMGIQALDFSYPYGKHTWKVRRIVKKVGLRSAVTTVYGVNIHLCDRYQMLRISVHNNHYGENLLSKINSNLLSRPRWQVFFCRILNRIFKNKINPLRYEINTK